jgi:FkbM family methyltransferase
MMCLEHGGEWVSNHIIERGRWRDCNLLALEWKRSGYGAGDIFLDAGANIGACTMEMLLRTGARVIAFESNPSNLFHLTRSLKLAATSDPNIANRVVVLPMGLGSKAGNVTITMEHKNSGNSELQPEADGGVARLGRTGSGKKQALGLVAVHRLDRVFPQPFNIRLMKMDVQGTRWRRCSNQQRSCQAHLRALHPIASPSNQATNATCCAAPSASSLRAPSTRSRRSWRRRGNSSRTIVAPVKRWTRCSTAQGTMLARRARAESASR